MLLVCLLVPGVEQAARSQQGTDPPLSLSCDTSTLLAPWTGSDAITCRVMAAAQVTTAMSFTCEDPPQGLACVVGPPTSGPSSDVHIVRLTATYADTLAPGRTSFRLVARHGGSEAVHTVAVVKDINTVSARCPSPDEIRAIDRDLRLVFDSDPTRGVASPDVCTEAGGSRNLTVMQARVYRSLATLKRLTFTERLPWTKDPVYRWLTRAVRGVRFRSDIANSNCCGSDGLINVKAGIQAGPNGGQADLALAVTETRMPTDFRLLGSFLQLLVHEARHRDGKPHTCGTRDQTIAEMGAWGAAWAFQRWIADRSAPDFVPPEVATQLRQQADNICRGQICDAICALR